MRKGLILLLTVEVSADRSDRGSLAAISQSFDDTIHAPVMSDPTSLWHPINIAVFLRGPQRLLCKRILASSWNEEGDRQRAKECQSASDYESTRESTSDFDNATR
jgi:hypothetical protein